MTDLDPLRSSTDQPDDLLQRAGESQRTTRTDPGPRMAGPTGTERTTESVGDPDRTSMESGAETGAGAGMLAGAAVAGPIGLPIGAAIGAATGAAAEAADADASTDEERRTEEGYGGAQDGGRAHEERSFRRDRAE